MDNKQNVEKYVVDKLDEVQQSLNAVKALVGSCDPKCIGSIPKIFRLCDEIEEKAIATQNVEARFSELDYLTLYNVTKTEGNA